MSETGKETVVITLDPTEQISHFEDIIRCIYKTPLLTPIEDLLPVLLLADKYRISTWTSPPPAPFLTSRRPSTITTPSTNSSSPPPRSSSPPPSPPLSPSSTTPPNTSNSSPSPPKAFSTSSPTRTSPPTPRTPYSISFINGSNTAKVTESSTSQGYYLTSACTRCPRTTFSTAFPILSPNILTSLLSSVPSTQGAWSACLLERGGW
uniref:BTB domain-containing protein n=1 Tax=Arcella intermedia TaxID=1963864 RepID=A0A6B2LIF5_9EUKA